MLDGDGTVLRCSGHVSHSAEDNGDVKVLDLYSYRMLVARMWRVRVGGGFRVFGWQHEGSHSVTTSKHMGGLSCPTTYGGVRVYGQKHYYSISDQPYDIEDIVVAYDYVLDQCAQDAEGLIEPMPGHEGLTFNSEDIGHVRVRFTRADEPNIFTEEDVMRMATPERMLRYVGYHGGFTHHRKVKTIVRQDRFHGYMVNGRGDGKIVGYWKCAPASPVEVADAS